MSKIYLITIFILSFCINNIYSQINVSGFVKDAETGEVLIGVNIVDAKSGEGTVSNNAGYFSLKINNESKIKVSHIGYAEQEISANLNADTLLNIFLAPGVVLKEVSVYAKTQESYNVSKLSAKEIKNIPALGGVPDVFRAVQMLPGITGQSEASSMLIVRGGDPGQNLYLLDNTPLIYVNHLGGFLSVFNPDIINDISVMKGGFPAQYGGKLSSIVDITQRSGNTKEHKGSFGVGITDINLTLEGPMSENASYIVTARKTVYDLLFLAASSLSNGNASTVAYGFHDINTKLTWNPVKKNKFFLNLYQGDDYFITSSKPESVFSNEKSTLTNVWGNFLVAGNWNYVASSKLFAESGVSFTRYRLKDKQTLEEANDFNYKNIFKSSVDDIALRSNWSYHLSNFYKIKFGGQHSFLRHNPYNLKQSGFLNSDECRVENSNHTALYLENKISIAKIIDFNIGLREVYYSNQSFNKQMLEPRASFTVKYSNNIKTNLSYMQINQTSHFLMSTSVNILANEIWIPASAEIQPSHSEQYSISNHFNFAGFMFSAEVSAYYKTMSNLVSYKEGVVNIKQDIAWESLIETDGNSESYGVELLLKKNYGDWTGNISYSWSETKRQFDNINQGKEYWYEYHRPHSFSIFAGKQLSEKWDFNIAWIFQSGVPYTPTIGRQYSVIPNLLDDNGNHVYEEVFIYGERNSAKMKNYHRLDIGFNYKKKSKRGNDAVWTFSVYNVYSRQNPNMYYYNVDASDQFIANHTNDVYRPQNLYQVSLFPIIPAVSYKVYFNKTENKTKKKKSVNWFYD